MTELNNANFFEKLRILFSTDSIIKKIEDDKIRSLLLPHHHNIETNITRTMRDKLGVYTNGEVTTTYGRQTQQKVFNSMRFAKYAEYETMDEDAIIASALDIYAEDAVTPNTAGFILEISTEDEKKKVILENLFYDILKIEFNLSSWIRNLVKYGDFFLMLEIAKDIGIVKVIPYSPYEIERVEDYAGSGEDTVEFRPTEHAGGTSAYSSYGNDMSFQNYEIIHFRLIKKIEDLPYGTSMIEGARRAWKNLKIMEDAMMIYRITRAPERRVFYVDVGNLNPNDIENYMNKVINKIKRIPIVDREGNVNLKYNVENIAEDYFFPTRGGNEGSRVEQLSGGNGIEIEDIEHLQDKLFAALKIPKSFLNYEEDLSDKSTLAQEDVRFARTIQNLQLTVINELNKIAMIHLYTQGYDIKDLMDFTIELNNPSVIHEIKQLEVIEKKFDVASGIMSNEIINRQWIYENIFGFSIDEMRDIEAGLVYDKKMQLRLEQIEQEGNDPWESGIVKDAEDNNPEGDGTADLSFSVPHKIFQTDGEFGDMDINTNDNDQIAKPAGNNPASSIGFKEMYMKKMYKSLGKNFSKRKYLIEGKNSTAEDNIIAMADDIEQFINRLDNKMKNLHNKGQ